MISIILEMCSFLCLMTVIWHMQIPVFPFKSILCLSLFHCIYSAYITIPEVLTPSSLLVSIRWTHLYPSVTIPSWDMSNPPPFILLTLSGCSPFYLLFVCNRPFFYLFLCIQTLLPACLSVYFWLYILLHYSGSLFRKHMWELASHTCFLYWHILFKHN